MDRAHPDNLYAKVYQIVAESAKTNKILKNPPPVLLSVALRLRRMVRYEHVSI